MRTVLKHEDQFIEAQRKDKLSKSVCLNMSSHTEPANDRVFFESRDHGSGGRPIQKRGQPDKSMSHRMTL